MVLNDFAYIECTTACTYYKPQPKKNSRLKSAKNNNNANNNNNKNNKNNNNNNNEVILRTAFRG